MDLLSTRIEQQKIAFRNMLLKVTTGSNHEIVYCSLYFIAKQSLTNYTPSDMICNRDPVRSFELLR